MSVYKIIIEVEAEDVPAAIAKLRDETDVLKYVKSVFPIREEQPKGGWANGIKSQLFYTKKVVRK